MAEGKSADELLIELENAKEAITNDLFMKALVSTEQIPKEGMQHLELIDNLLNTLEKKIQEEK